MNGASEKIETRGTTVVESSSSMTNLGMGDMHKIGVLQTDSDPSETAITFRFPASLRQWARTATTEELAIHPQVEIVYDRTGEFRAMRQAMR